VNLRGEPVAAPVVKEEKKAEGEPDGRRCLWEFYMGLKLLETDEKRLFERRGLETRTSALLGFRSNPKQNRIALLALPKRYDWEELAASGLWLREDRQKAKKRRPNVKFSGFGISGRNEKGEWTYAWNNPVLIPYFDEKGVLVSLRPHKDMGPGGTVTGTPHVYVPRAINAAATGIPGTGLLSAKEEKFEVVVVTEGEFKAAALWQLLGAGRSDGGVPIGVCALPGISFGKNYEIREELDGWLRAVKARRVIVVYDNEDKANPKLESFKPDKRKRYDAVIWARYLATDLAHKVHVRGEVAMLPVEWRDAKGKADWDGALSAVREGRIK
jgi:hypothetical protein